MKIVDERIVNAILAFRDGSVIIHPGGGGQYGWLELPQNLKEEQRKGKLEPEKITAPKNKKGSKSLKEEKTLYSGQISFLDLEKKAPGKSEKKAEELGNKESDKTKGQSSLFEF